MRVRNIERLAMNSSPPKSSCDDKLRPSPQREENYPGRTSCSGLRFRRRSSRPVGAGRGSANAPFRAVRYRQRQPSGLYNSYMHGPATATPCTSSTSILDGLNGTAPHVRDRVNFAVVAKSQIERIRTTARERGWRNLPAVFGREHLQPRLPRREQRRQPASVAECFCQTGW